MWSRSEGNVAARYTRELLEEAARGTRHIDDAVRWCGGSPTPGSRRYLRQKMAAADIDISHFATNQVRHTEERLRAAVATSTSIKDVVRHLGISQVGGNQTHIGRRIAALGIDTSHFVAVRRGRPKGSLGGPLCLRSAADGRVPGDRLRRAAPRRRRGTLRHVRHGAGAERGRSGTVCRSGLRWITSTATGGTTARRTISCCAPTAMR